MFTRDDIATVEELDKVAKAYLVHRPPRYVKFDQYAFKDYESEQSIMISRAGKQLQENGAIFWAASRLLEYWSDREAYFYSYLCHSSFESITENRFNELVSESCAELVFPLKLPLRRDWRLWRRGKFVGAMILRKEWHTVDLFAEYENEYLHFYWDTTA